MAVLMVLLAGVLATVVILLIPESVVALLTQLICGRATRGDMAAARPRCPEWCDPRFQTDLGRGRMLTYNDRDQTTQVNTEAAGYEDIDRAQRAALGTRGFLNTPLGVTRYTDPAAVTDVIREPTGQLTALRRTGSGTRYPITDALGSVIALTDPAGAKTDTFSYDPYGADTGRTGTTENPYRYAGEHRDPTGPYKIRLRYYTPELGRWTQPDPLHRSVNPINPPEASPYIYAANNPCNYTDPTGTVSMDCVVGAATFSGAIAAAMLFPTSHLIRGAFVVVGVGGNIYSYTNKLAACPPRAKSEHLYGQDTYDHVTD